MSRKRQQKHDRPLHVCNLSISALNEVERQIEDKQTTINTLGPEEHFKVRGLLMELNSLRWIQLSMQYNRHHALQYIHENNSDKGSNPKFRQILMRPMFNFWRIENNRNRWCELQKAIMEKAAEQRINARADHFQRQRTVISSNKFAKRYNEFDNLTRELLDKTDLEYLFAYMTPESTDLRFLNRNRNYCSSDALSSWSDSEEEEEKSDGKIEKPEHEEEEKCEEQQPEKVEDQDEALIQLKERGEPELETQDIEITKTEDEEQNEQQQNEEHNNTHSSKEASAEEPIDTAEGEEENEKEKSREIEQNEEQQKEEEKVEQTEEKTETPKKKSKTIDIIIFIAIVALFVATLTIIYYLFAGKNGTLEDETNILTTTQEIIDDDQCVETV